MARYAITTFGCQMNVHDSERMHEVLRAGGYEEGAGLADADVIVLNTCSVREKAEQKLLSELGRLAKLKQDRPELVIVVAGCVAQQEGERLLKKSRGVDLVVGPDNIPELPRLLEELGAGALPFARTEFDLDSPQFLTALHAPGVSGAVSAFVTTMKGCDERCSFCIVPYTRGPERYRRSAEIIDEISALVARGAAEVMLLGQTVNSYRDPDGALAPAPEADPDDADESEFAALLREISVRVPGLKRLRYTSPHPRHLVPSLARAHAELAVLPRHVHMPVQSGSDRVLKRMIRRYTRADYVARVNDLRARVPGLTLSTDVIVGFPGETDADFDATLSLVEEVGFLGVYGFKYSRRPYTPALKLDDDVTEVQKSERLARLFAITEPLIAAHLRSLVGTRCEVLVEGAAKRHVSEDGPAPHQRSMPRPTTFTGRSERNEIVHIEDEAAGGLIGEVVQVTAVRALKHSLVGALDPEARDRGLAKLAKAAPHVAPRRSLPLVAATD